MQPLSAPTIMAQPLPTDPEAAGAGGADTLPPSITQPVPRIDAFLDRCVREAALPPNLIDAILYSLLGPGKRARPLLVWHAFAAVAGTADPAPALPAAGAIELIHAFSLVHDDLPGMDDDDLRRGRPTLHRHTTAAMAILAGDSMLALAFQVLAERVEPLWLAALLSRELAAATNAMIAGQVYDTLGGFDGRLDPAAKLELIHSSKTGALIRCACRMGALSGLSASASDPSAATPASLLNHPALAAITTYAETAGLMFQIVDDLLDVTQTTAHLGKKAGKDQEAGKLTYPGVFGVDRSRAEVARLHAASLEALAPLGPAADPLRRLSTFMANRTR